MPTTLNRYEQGERAPRFAQRPAPRRMKWSRAALAVVVVVAALAGLALGGAFNLLSPAPDGAVVEGTAVHEPAPSARP